MGKKPKEINKRYIELINKLSALGYKYNYSPSEMLIELKKVKKEDKDGSKTD